MNVVETRQWLQQLHQSPRQALYRLNEIEKEEQEPMAHLMELKDWQQLKMAILAEDKKVPSRYWPDGSVPVEYTVSRRGVEFIKEALGKVSSAMVWSVWMILWEIDKETEGSEALAQLWPDPGEFLVSSAAWDRVPPGPLVLADASDRTGQEVRLIPPNAKALKPLIGDSDKRIRELGIRLSTQIKGGLSLEKAGKDLE